MNSWYFSKFILKLQELCEDILSLDNLLVAANLNCDFEKKSFSGVKPLAPTKPIFFLKKEEKSTITVSLYFKQLQLKTGES